MPDVVLSLGGHHRAVVGATEAIALLAVPLLWVVGVVLFIVHKLRTR
jgi:hypothetical protein